MRRAIAVLLLAGAAGCTHARLAARPQKDGGAWIEVSTTFLGFTTDTDLFYCAPGDAYAPQQGGDYHRACREPGIHRVHEGLLPVSTAAEAKPAPEAKPASEAKPPPTPPRPPIEPKD